MFGLGPFLWTLWVNILQIIARGQFAARVLFHRRKIHDSLFRNGRSIAKK